MELKDLEKEICEMCGTEFEGVGSVCSQECVDELFKRYIIYNKNNNNG